MMFITSLGRKFKLAFSRVIAWILLLLVVIGLLFGCSPNEVLDSLQATSTVTPTAASVPLSPTALTAPTETATPQPTIELQETETPQAIGPTAANTPRSTATMTTNAEPAQDSEPENPVVEIPLAGPVASDQAELSGLAWYGDYLIILPQYPDFNSDQGDGFVFALPRTDIIAFLDGQISQPLEPRPIQFIAPGLKGSITGFQGYEAIAFIGEDVFVTIETRAAGGMLGYLVKGSITPDLTALTLDTSNLRTVNAQTDIGNMSEESLFLTDEVVGTIYELNARIVNASPVAHLFDHELTPIDPVGFPNVEFRVTDVTELDQDGRFWAINYFFPGAGEVIGPPDSQTEPQEGNESPAQTQPPWKGVGRLIELQYAPTGITFTGSAPIRLELLLNDIHNWEGLARLDDRGFLLVSDEFPDTVLGFVPFPDVP